MAVSSAGDESFDGLRQLSHLVGGVAGPDGPGDAVVDVVFEEDEAHFFESRSRRVDLGQYVDAVAILVDHALQSANLALDALEPGVQ